MKVNSKFVPLLCGCLCLAVFLVLALFAQPKYAQAGHVEHAGPSASGLLTENEEDFKRWREEIPDYERRLYNRVKDINSRTLRNLRAIIIGNVVFLIVMVTFLVLIRGRLKKISIAIGQLGIIDDSKGTPDGRTAATEKRLPWHQRFSRKLKSPRVRRALVVGVGLIVLVGLPLGIMLTGTEYLIRLDHKPLEGKAAEEAIKNSSAAYDTPGQRATNSPGLAQMEYHYFIGYIPVPNRIVRGYDTERGYVTNNGHFRYDEDFPREKPPGEIRVFVTGGSTAWGSGVNQDQMHTIVAERMFAEKYGTKVRIVNAAAGAHTSTQERIYLENHILDFAPDMVVMFSGWNDTYFSFQGIDLIQDSDFFKYQKQLIKYFEPRAVVLSEKAEIFYKRSPPPNYEKYSLKILWAIDRLIHEVRSGSGPPALPMRDTYLGLARNIRIVDALSKSFNFDFVFYLQPTVFNTAHQLTALEMNPVGNANVPVPDEEEQRQEPSGGFGHYNAKLYAIYRQRLPELARELGFTYSDSDDALAVEKRTVFADSVHFGDRDYRLIGEHLFKVIENRLLARGLLSPKS